MRTDTKIVDGSHEVRTDTKVKRVTRGENRYKRVKWRDGDRCNKSVANSRQYTMKGDVIIYKLLQLITTLEACHAGLELKRDDRLGRRASRFPGRCTMFILSRMNMALINLSYESSTSFI